MIYNFFLRHTILNKRQDGSFYIDLKHAGHGINKRIY
jgi:hypothetical protein